MSKRGAIALILFIIMTLEAVLPSAWTLAAEITEANNDNAEVLSEEMAEADNDNAEVLSEEIDEADEENNDNAEVLSGEIAEVDEENNDNAEVLSEEIDEENDGSVVAEDTNEDDEIEEPTNEKESENASNDPVENEEEGLDKSNNETTNLLLDSVNVTSVEESTENSVYFDGGNGTYNDPYIIITVEQLKAISNNLNAYYKLGADIDLSGEENWTPIGNSTNPFKGSFNGGGHTIKNLKIQKETSYNGLFGYATSSSSYAEQKFTNVKLKNVNINAGNYTGALVGYCSGGISNVVVTGGKVVGKNYVGGLTGGGYIYYTENYSKNSTNIEVEGYDYVGGLIGKIFTTESRFKIESCYTKGNVKGHDNVGGLIGWEKIVPDPLKNGEYSEILLCYQTGTVKGNENVGGFIGYASTDKKGSSSSEKEIGLKITECYSSGNITGWSCVGGLIGFHHFYAHYGVIAVLIIENCFTTGEITSNSYAASFVGKFYWHDGDWSWISIRAKESYGRGKINCTSNAGALYGSHERYDGGDNDLGSNCYKTTYWITDTTGQTKYIDKNMTANKNVAIGKSLQDMINKSTYSTDWDFNDTWSIGYNGLRTTAYLKKLPMPSEVVLLVDDTDKPDYAIVENIENELTSRSFSVNIRTKDSITGIETIKLYLDGQLVETYNGDLADVNEIQKTYSRTNLEKNSEHEIYFIATDFAGNSLTSNKLQFKMKGVPDVDIIPSTLNLTNQDVVITLNAENLTTDQKIQYKLNGGSWTDYKSPFIVSKNSTIIARATDGINNGEQTSWVVDYIDKTAPTINGKYLGKKLKLDINDIGVSGLAYYQYVISDKRVPNGETPNYCDPIEMTVNGSVDIDITNNGENFVYVKAVDKLGNEKTEMFGGYYLPETTINLEIEKVSNRSDDIKLAKAEFLIEGKYGTTNTDGIAKFQLVGKEIGTYEYILKETKAPEGYDAIPETRMDITYNYYGEVEKVTTNRSDVIVESFDKQLIKLKVVDKKQDVSEYKVIVKAYDSNKEDKLISGIEYKVTVNPEHGAAQFSQKGKTDKDGIYKVNYLSGYGKTSIKVEQLASVLGYELNSEETVLVLNKDLETGKLSIIPELNYSSLKYEINNNEKNPAESTVVIYVENVPKEHKNTLSLMVQEDSLNGITNVCEEEFVLEQPYSLGEIEGATNQDGILRFDDLVPLTKGDYVYRIIPKGNRVYRMAPRGGDLNTGEIRVIVTYDEFNEITNVRKITDNINKIEYSVFEEEDIYYNNYDIKVLVDTKDSDRKTQKIKLRNSDFDDDNIALNGIVYTFKITDNTGTRKITKTTDVFGEISLDVYADLDSKITVEQIKNVKGYVLNAEPKDLYLKYNETAESLAIDFDSTNNNLDVAVDPDTNIITIKERSKKKIGEEKPGNICLFLFKMDNGATRAGLGKVKFKVQEKTSGLTFLVETDENGRAESHDFPVSGPGEYEFTITELETIYGFKKFESPIKVQIIYEERDNELKTQSIIVTQGYKYVDYKKCDEYETDTVYQLDIFFDLTNNVKLVPDDGNVFINLILEKIGEQKKSDVADAEPGTEAQDTDTEAQDTDTEAQDTDAEAQDTDTEAQDTDTEAQEGIEFDVKIVYPDDSTISFTAKTDEARKNYS